jgi:hypothetical protein
MENKKKQRNEYIGNVNIFVRKYKLALFLIVCIVVFVLLSSSQVYAGDNSLQGIDCEQSEEDRLKQAKAICAARYPGEADSSSNRWLCCLYLIASCSRDEVVTDAIKNCDTFCKNQHGSGWRGVLYDGGDTCACELTKEGCEDICQKGDVRAHYEYISPEQNCYCSCDGKLRVWNGKKCECISNAVPAGGDDCKCDSDSGYNLDVLGKKCVEKEEVVVVEKKTPIDKERERLKNKYPGLAPGYVLFVEGMVNTLPLRAVIGYDKYGHSALYIGDYQVTKGNEFQVRSEDAAPLRVFRDGTQINLILGEQTKEGDVIIGAVVEARRSGIIVTTVDKVEDVAREYFNGKRAQFCLEDDILSAHCRRN